MDIEILLREADPARGAHLPGPDPSLGRSIRSHEISSKGLRHRFGAVVAAAVIAAVVVTAVVPATNRPSPSPATVVLDRMATLTSHQDVSVKPGEYYYTELGGQASVGLGSLVAGGPTVTSYQADTVQTWVAPNGSGRRVTTTDPTPRFFTAQARAAWVAAGRSLVSPFPAPPSTVQLFGAGYAFTSNPIIRVFNISHLPTDIAMLTTLIAQGRTEPQGSIQTELKGLGPVSNCQTRDCVIFERVAILLQGPDIGATAARRAALFKVMAHIPGVTLLGSVADPIGRRGTGLELVQRIPAHTVTCNNITSHQPASQTVEEVVIDPKTATLLSAETRYSPMVVTKGEAECGHQVQAGVFPIPPHWTLLLRTGIVDSDATIPK
jgi:hypothetical protein